MRKTFKGSAATLAVVALLAFPAGPARAAALQASPVTIEFLPGQAAAMITVANRGAQATAVQVRAFAWSQPGGIDRLDTTEQLHLSPPVFELAPGGSQIVRMIHRVPPGGATETTFRLLVDEIPGPDQTAGLRMALRLSLPVFVEPATRAESLIEWRIADGALVGRNRGTRRVRVFDVALAGPNAAPIALDQPATPYILAGAERRWPLRAAATLPPGGVLRLTARADTRTVDASVPVTPSR